MRDFSGWLGSVFGGAIFGGILIGVGQFFVGAGWSTERMLYGLAGGAALGGLAGWYAIVQDRKHARELAELCERLNFTFDARPPEHLKERVNLPRDGRVDYRMAKTSGSVSIELLDISYLRRGGGDDAGGTVRKTIALLTGADPALPDFVLQPNLPSIVRKVIGSLGVSEGFQFSTDGPDAAGVRAFTENYMVHSRYAASTTETATEEATRAAAHELRRVFNLELLTWFADHPGWHVESKNGQLCIERGGGLWPAREREELIMRCLKIFELIAQPPDTPAANIQVAVAPAGKVKGNLLFSMFWRMAVCFMAGGMVGMALTTALFAAGLNPPPLVIGPVFFAGPLIGLALGVYWGYRALLKPTEN